MLSGKSEARYFICALPAFVPACSPEHSSLVSNNHAKELTSHVQKDTRLARRKSNADHLTVNYDLLKPNKIIFNKIVISRDADGLAALSQIV